MSMSKQDFIQLADEVRSLERCFKPGYTTRNEYRGMLARFCSSQNPRFDRQRWLDYIDGKCGPSGGAIKARNGS